MHSFIPLEEPCLVELQKKKKERRLKKKVNAVRVSFYGKCRKGACVSAAIAFFELNAA